MALRIAVDVRHTRDFGIGTYIRNLLRALSELDRENRYILTAYPDDAGEFRSLGPNFEVVNYTRRDYEFSDNFSYPYFVRRLAADLYHIPLNSVPLLMPRPYVVTIHDMSSFLFDKETSGFRQNLRLYRFRRGLLRADRVIAISAATRRDVENLLGIPAERIRLVYSAPDPKFSEHAGAPESLGRETRQTLERYRIEYPFLLYAGRIRPHKNVPRMIEAFAVLRGQLEGHPIYSDIRLLIIGDEISRHPEVRRTVIQTRMEQWVRFLGFIPFDRLRTFYSAAAAFVFPSLYEGFGLPPLEAMASGTPVVTANVSSLPEVVGRAAVFVNPENVFDIARGMREVLLDEDLRAQLRKQAATQLAKFSWDQTAANVLSVYREISRLQPR